MNPVWSHAIAQIVGGPTSSAEVANAVVGGDGSVVVAGHYYGSLDFGDGLPRAASLQDGYVLSLAADGSFRWVRTYDNALPLAASSLASGQVVLAGRLDGPTNFGAGTVAPVSASTSAGFLVRLESDGSWAAETIFGLEGANQVSGLAVGPGDSVAIGGVFSGRVTLGGATRISEGGRDVFVFRPGT